MEKQLLVFNKYWHVSRRPMAARNEMKQNAIPVLVIKQVHKLYSSSKDPLTVALAQLIMGAFFFAMRSCEHSKTTSPAESKPHNRQYIFFQELTFNSP
jgi:hypothetical protein